jgi:DNA polymerase III epsilon subunit-like protein
MEAQCNDVMIDLETMDNKPTSAITAIGAVWFNKDTGLLGEEFYIKVDLQSSMDFGLSISADTIAWWLQQADAPRLEMAKKGEGLDNALNIFRQKFSGTEAVWGNGASFDNAILNHAFSKVGFDLPWKFWNDRCYRTVKNMYPDIVMMREGTHHNALDDAKSQAIHLIDIYKEINHVKS